MTKKHTPLWTPLYDVLEHAERSGVTGRRPMAAWGWCWMKGSTASPEGTGKPSGAMGLLGEDFTVCTSVKTHHIVYSKWMQFTVH